MNCVNKALAGAMLGAVILAVPAQAQNLRFELTIPATSPWHEPLVRFTEKLREVGVTSSVSNGSILSPAEMCAGMRDGIVDGGLCLFPYNPSDFPEANLMATMTMFATSGTPADNPEAAMTGAMIEYMFLNCPDCQEEIKGQNHVYLGSASTPIYDLLCRSGSHINALADFKGKRIRSGGANFSRIAEYFGASAILMKAGEVFEALDKGVIDCIMVSASELITLRLIEVTDQVILGWPGGVYVGQNFPGMNRDSWKGLSDEQRAVAIKAASEAAADAVFSFSKGNEAGLRAGRDKGMAIVEATPEMKAKTVEFLAGDLAAIRKEFTEQYGVQNVDAKLALAQQLIEKWKGLTDGELAEERLANLLWDEIYAKVDPATYGMD